MNDLRDAKEWFYPYWEQLLDKIGNIIWNDSRSGVMFDILITKTSHKELKEIIDTYYRDDNEWKKVLIWIKAKLKEKKFTIKYDINKNELLIVNTWKQQIPY